MPLTCGGCPRQFGSYKIFDAHLGTDEILEQGVNLAKIAAKAGMFLAEMPGHKDPSHLKNVFLDTDGVWRQHGGIKPGRPENGPET